MKEFQLNTIEEAIEEIKKGNFVIVVDDEDRENEGDLILAAECITPKKSIFSKRMPADLFVPLLPSSVPKSWIFQ